MISLRMLWASPLSLLCIYSSLLFFNAVALSIPLDPTIVTSLNATSFPDFSTNLTNLGAIDPKKFSLVIKVGDDKLAPAATLMNAVDVMVQLALMDIDGRMPQTAFRLDIPKYSQVEILISPISTAPGATLPPGIGILGLFDIIRWMLTDPTQRFKSVHAYLSYEKREVGTMEIRKPLSASSASPSDQTDGTAPHLLTISNTTQLSSTMLTAPAWADPHLQVSHIQDLDSFTVWEMFFMVLSFIREISPTKRTSRVVDFSISIDAPPITMAGQPIAISFKNHDSPPRTAANPPYFKVEWLIKAFGQLPLYMFDHADFREVLMGIKVDGVPVGEGYVVRKRKGQSGVLTDTS